MLRWRRESRGIVPLGRNRVILLWCRGGRGRRGAGCFNYGGKCFGGDEAHKEKSLEDGVRELWSLMKQLGSFGGVCSSERLHL
jgi:hypothetical protein